MYQTHAHGRSLRRPARLARPWQAVAGVGLAALCLGAAAPAGASTAVTDEGTAPVGRTWDLAADFRTAPDQVNPSPDGYGNDDVWEYLSGLPGKPSSYVLLPEYTNARHGFDGLASWMGTEFAPDAIPHVGVNATGHVVEQPSGGRTVTWPAGRAFMHPHDAQHAAVAAWNSPITHDVNVHARLSMAEHPNCGNGISWSLWKNSTRLAGGVVTPRKRTQLNLPTYVTSDDALYLTVAARNGNFWCDSTIVDLTVKVV